MADRKISELSEISASDVSPSDLLLLVDVDNPDINDRSQRFTVSGLTDYVYQRLSAEGQGQRFYTDVQNSEQRGFFGSVGLDTISGNTVNDGNVVNIASGVTLNFAYFDKQNLIEQNESAPTDSGVILWYRPAISGLLGRTYFRYINPTGIGPSAIEWKEASPFEASIIDIGTQQVISGVFSPLRIPAATNSPDGYGGIRYTDVAGHVLNASGVFANVPLATSGYPGAIPSISGVAEGLPLVKIGGTLTYAPLPASAIDTDFSLSPTEFGKGTQAAPSITFTGDVNTGLYSPTADQVGITVSGFEHFRVARNLVTISGALNVNNGALTTEQDASINSIEIGRGGGGQLTNTRVGDNALQGNTTGTGNTAAGKDALQGNTTGTGNTAAGKDALLNNQGGVENTSIGHQSLYSNVGGSNSTALGGSALYSANNVNNNTAIGQSSLHDVVAGSNNTAVGAQSLVNTLTSNNVGIGFEAGLTNTTGANNTLIGNTAGKSLTTGSNNTIIGTVLGSAGMADTVIIAAGSNEKIKVDSSNNVLLTGTVKPLSGGTGAAPIYTTSGDPDTGLFFPSANTAGVSVSGLGRIGVDINRVTVSGTFLATTISGTTLTSTLGTASAPSYTFSGDLNTGIYSPAADRIGITVSGLTKLAIDINRTTVSGTFQADTISGTTIAASLGSVSVPSYTFSGDINTGIYSPSADVVAIASSGVQVVRFEADQGSVFAGPIRGTTISGGSLIIGSDLSAGSFVPTSPTLPENGLYLPLSNTLGFSTNTSEKLRLDVQGNVKIGGIAERATTSGTRQLILFNGVAPVGALVSGVSLYSSSGELYSMNAGGTGSLVLNSSNFSVYTPSFTGTGASGTWDISITGSSASTTGNAATATALNSARNFTISGEITGTTSSDLTSGVTINTSIAVGAIDNSNVNAAAAIAGTKINPDFGAQDITTTSVSTAARFIPTGATVPTNGVYLPSANALGIATNSIERVRIDNVGNTKIGGTADRATNAGTNQLVLFNGTAPIGTLASGVSLYSSSGELYSMNASGIASQIASTAFVASGIATVVRSDITGISGADAISNMVSLTQAEYDAIGSPSATTLYIITD